VEEDRGRPSYERLRTGRKPKRFLEIKTSGRRKGQAEDRKKTKKIFGNKDEWKKTGADQVMRG
jgi:hypothetical protein